MIGMSRMAHKWILSEIKSDASWLWQRFTLYVWCTLTIQVFARDSEIGNGGLNKLKLSLEKFTRVFLPTNWLINTWYIFHYNCSEKFNSYEMISVSINSIITIYKIRLHVKLIWPVDSQVPFTYYCCLPLFQSHR